MAPLYDEQKHAKILVSEYSEHEALDVIIQFPVSWLELEILKTSDIDAARSGIAKLVSGLSPHLEFLRVDYIFDATAENHDEFRDVLPASGKLFAELPKIDRVVFNRVNVNDRHITQLCKNKSLTKVDIRRGDVTIRCVNYLKQLPNLRFVEFDRCQAIPLQHQDWLRHQLPRLEVARIR